MRLGWCGPPQSGSRALAAGYDYLEVPLGPMNLEEAARYDECRSSFPDTGLPPLVFNQFLPHTLRVVGPDIDRDRILRYIDRVAHVMTGAHARVLVFGSGWARVIPPGWSRARAIDQLLEMLSWCGSTLAGTGIVLALEPQNEAETNFITTLAEAVSTVAMVNHRSIRVLADIYHLHMAREPVSAVIDAAAWLAHVHVSDSGRALPGLGEYEFQPFFTALHSAGYRGAVSVEVFDHVSDEGMRDAADWVRGQWARAAGSNG